MTLQVLGTASYFTSSKNERYKTTHHNTMTVGLIIPCYVNQLYPDAKIVTRQLLQTLGVNIVYPHKQTCCGQSMANSGFEHLTQACSDHFIENFSRVDC